MSPKVITGVDGILARLAAREKKADNVAVVQVGYTQNYALYVHERVDIPHKVGQAKYLAQPLRQEKNQIQDIIVNAMKAGVPLKQALLMGGMFLQRLSQKLVPIDTSALKNSAYTKAE
tara:strand:+ start:27715 stop:28068 length:354 start_codon:yes stop_codon:yes gene_type:complete